MKRKVLIVALAMLLVCSLVMVGCSSKTESEPAANGTSEQTTTAAANQEVIKWKMQSMLPNLPGKAETQDYFCEMVNELTEGQLQITSFAAGEIVDSMEVSGAVETGVIEAAHWYATYDMGKNTATSIIGNNPMKMTPDDVIHWWHNGGGQELTNEIYNEWGIQAKLLAAKDAQIVGQFKEQIDSLEKMQGKVLRASGMGAMIYEELGLSTVTLAGGEIYTAMERGVIDMVEFGDPADNMAMGFHEIAPYILLPGWQEPASQFLLLVNTEAWNELSPDLQRKVDLAAELTVIHSKVVLEALSAESLNEMKAQGCVFMQLSDEDLATIDAACNTVLDRMAAENPVFDKVLKSQLAYLDSFKLRKELADLSYGK